MKDSPLLGLRVDHAALRAEIETLLPHTIDMPPAWTQVRGGADDVNDPQAFAYKFSLERHNVALTSGLHGYDIILDVGVQICARKRVRAKFLFVTATPLIEGCTDRDRRVTATLRIVPKIGTNHGVSAKVELLNLETRDELILREPRLGIPLANVSSTVKSHLAAVITTKQDDIAGALSRQALARTDAQGSASTPTTDPFDPSQLAPADADVALALPWRRICKLHDHKYLGACEHVVGRSGLRLLAPVIERLYAFHIPGRGQVIVAEADASVAPFVPDALTRNPEFSKNTATLEISGRLFVYYSDTAGLANYALEKRGAPADGGPALTTRFAPISEREFWALAALDGPKVRAFATKVGLERRLDAIADHVRTIALYVTGFDGSLIEAEARIEYKIQVELSDVQLLSSAFHEGMQRCTCFTLGEPRVEGTIVLQPLASASVSTLTSLLELF